MYESWLAWISVLAVLAAGVVFVGATQRQMHRRQRQHLASFESLRNDISGLCAGAVRLGDRLVRLEQQLRSLRECQERLAVVADSGQAYGEAIRMVRDGAGVDELVASCDCTRAEAELLVRLHGPTASERKT